MKLKIKAVSDKIGKDIPYPFYATAGAAAMDLCACVDAPVEVAPRALVSIPTGIAIALPSADYVALVFALLSFLAVVVVSRLVAARRRKRPEREKTGGNAHDR